MRLLIFCQLSYSKAQLHQKVFAGTTGKLLVLSQQKALMPARLRAVRQMKQATQAKVPFASITSSLLSPLPVKNNTFFLLFNQSSKQDQLNCCKQLAWCRLQLPPQLGWERQARGTEFRSAGFVRTNTRHPEQNSPHVGSPVLWDMTGRFIPFVLCLGLSFPCFQIPSGVLLLHLAVQRRQSLAVTPFPTAPSICYLRSLGAVGKGRILHSVGCSHKRTTSREMLAAHAQCNAQLLRLLSLD